MEAKFFHHHNQSILVVELILGLFIVISIDVGEIEAQAGISPVSNAHDFKNNIKLALTKMKIREVPLAKARGEQLLRKLYEEERELLNDMENIEKKFDKLSDVKVNENNEDHELTNDQAIGGSKALVLVAKIAEHRARELERNKQRLAEVQRRIAEAKFVTKHPETYITVPKLSGVDPKTQQELERQILIKDRENIHYRTKIATGRTKPPLWMTDEW